MTETKKTCVELFQKLRIEIFVSIIFAGLFFGVFASIVQTDKSLLTIDLSLGSVILGNFLGPESFLGYLLSGGLWGHAINRPLSLSNILMAFCPPTVFNDFIYGIYLFSGTFFLVLFLRLRRVGIVGAAFGGIVAFWTGSNLTLLYSGHLFKFGIIALAAATLVCIEKAVMTRKLAWSLMAGGTLGLMFLEQQDVALFIGIFLGLYAVYATLRENAFHGRDTAHAIRSLFMRLGPMVIVALLLVGPIAGSTYKRSVSDTAVMGENSSREQKWAFSTQWSLPIEESLDFILPNFFGIRTGEPEGPYWGRTGQDLAWKATGQGLKNLRTEGLYVGLIPVMLALLALALALFRAQCYSPGITKKAKLEPAHSDDNFSIYSRNWRLDILFWGVVLALTLMLSWGRFFPLYQFFWSLPLMGTIRNPNKHLHMFQIALGILSAFGLDALLRGNWKESRSARRCVFGMAIGMAALSVVFLVAFASVKTGSNGLERTFLDAGWNDAAPVIVRQMQKALSHGVLMALAGAIILGVIIAGKLRNTGTVRVLAPYCAALLLALVAIDYVAYSRNYVKTIDVETAVGPNNVTRFLHKNLGGQRALFLNQSGIYGQWVTMLFRAQNIPLFNVPSMERLPADLMEFLNVVGKNPVRMWELAAVGYALGPAQIWPQIQRTPGFRENFIPVKGFSLVARRGGGIGVVAVPLNRNPQHLVFRFKRGLDRYTLVPAMRTVPSTETCKILADPEFDPRKEVLVTPEKAHYSNALSKEPSSLLEGSVRVEAETLRTMELSVTTKRPAVLLVSQRYDPDFRATVNGDTTPVFRCNHVMMGLGVPTGENRVVIQYRPSRIPLAIQAGGLAIAIAACVWLLLGGIVHRRKAGV